MPEGEMDSNNIVQGLWVGSVLPTMQRLSISSFIANGHTYHLYCYDELQGVPDGVRVKDASQILPRSSICTHEKYDTYAAPFSDMFRYRLLLEHGGLWADTDVVCLRPFRFTNEYVFSSEHRLLHGVMREVPTITVMKAPSGASFLEELYEEVNKLGRSFQWNDSGAGPLNRMIDKYSLHNFVERASVFCPLPTSLFERVVKENVQFSFEKTTCAIHLWHELWRRAKLNVDATFAAASLYEQLKRQYLEGAAIRPEAHFVLE